jgi:hypothetical protein
MTTLDRVKSACIFGNAVQQLPEWNLSLDTLSPTDRKLAERWINMDGAETFARIVLAVAATKTKGRPAETAGEFMITEAAGLLRKNRDMKPGTAAAMVARRVVADGDWRGRLEIGEDGLSNWIQTRLKQRRPAMKRQADRTAAAWRAVWRAISGQHG